MNHPSRHPAKGRATRLARRLAPAAVALVALAAGWLALEAARLPSRQELRAELPRRYPAATMTSWQPLWRISPALQEAVVAWEDPAFYHHGGVSYRMAANAAAENLRALRYARGGSTLTQQVAKNLFLTQEKTLRRKWQDAILAWRLEESLSKDEILEVYLNTAEWGEGLYGAEAAARRYFGVGAAELDQAQAATLAGMLNNPRTLNPCAAPEEARRRRDMILERLRGEGRVKEEEYAAAVGSEVGARCGVAG